MPKERTKSILIAEDSKQDFELVKISLEENNYQGDLKWFQDGSELLEYLEGESFKQESLVKDVLILLDINMPSTNGFAVLEKIKSDSKLKLIPCILLTTSSSEHDVQKGYLLGANSYITKPFDFDSMLDLFKSIKSYWLEKTTLAKLN